MVEEEDNISNVFNSFRGAKERERTTKNRPEPNSQNTILTGTTTARDGNNTDHTSDDEYGREKMKLKER